MKGHLSAKTFLAGRVTPCISNGATSSKVTEALDLALILSIIHIDLGNSIGGLASPVSPYKYFLRVSLLITLNPIRS